MPVDEADIHALDIGVAKPRRWKWIGVASCFLALGLTALILMPSWRGTRTKSESADAKVSQSVQPKNYVLQFDGTDDFVALPDNLIRNSQTLTVEAWFKTSKGGVILGYQTTTFPQIQQYYVPVLYVGRDGFLRGKVWSAPDAVNPIQSPKPLNDDLWHHAALVATDKGQHLYVDGIPSGTINCNALTHLDMSSNQIGIGFASRWPGGADEWYGFSGSIKEFSIWYAARNQAEIRQDMTKPLTGKEKGLAALYRMNEADGEVVKDRSPNGRSGKLGGGSPINKPKRVEDKAHTKLELTPITGEGKKLE